MGVAMEISKDLEHLETEIRFFEAHRKEWLKHYRDKWVLVKGTDLVGVFDSYEAAYEQGVAKYGTEPFLVKQVLENDAVEQMPALMLGLIRARE